MNKSCCECKLNLDTSLFYVHKETKDGFGICCKNCIKLINKTKYSKNKENYSKKSHAYYLKNSGAIKNKASEWGKENKEKKEASHKKWRDSHKEKLRAYSKQYLTVPENKYKKYEAGSRWKKNNLDKVSAYAQNRRAKELQRTPPWAKEIMDDYMKMLCKFRDSLTKHTGIKQSIEHTIPLQGKLISGLHLPYNLEIMSLSKNAEKQNKFTPTIETFNPPLQVTYKYNPNLNKAEV